MSDDAKESTGSHLLKQSGRANVLGWKLKGLAALFRGMEHADWLDTEALIGLGIMLEELGDEADEIGTAVEPATVFKL